jgi:hypothetical protein
MATPTKDRFQTGATVPTTGIYKIIHAEHRLPHEVILSGGDIFPRCAKCSDVVIFELLREVRAKFEYQPIQVYELPEIDEEEKADSADASG